MTLTPKTAGKLKAMVWAYLTFDAAANETYYIKFMNVLENEGAQFYMDYIEYCPKSVYDNPTEPEDIW